MILVDSSVIIDFWKFHNPDVGAVLYRQDVCLCGSTLAELMHGALDLRDCERIEQEISRFVRISIRDEDWSALGRNLYRLRVAGVHVPFADAILATVAIVRGMEVWSFDSHCALIRRALTELKVFQGPR